MRDPRSWPVYWAEVRSDEEWSAAECRASSPAVQQLAALLPALPASQLGLDSPGRRAAVQEVWATLNPNNALVWINDYCQCLLAFQLVSRCSELDLTSVIWLRTWNFTGLRVLEIVVMPE